ncbi:RNA polymerase sigma factor [Brevibacillus brevis]|uniref:Sigma-70 family RNA polymerase sigma factor n=1 Tax=Brevibacillus brevis TaxID=1393 RepID=A0A517ICK9_BREBE|nr:sigma-70 family RNA polymerase sigma factor [Brevibacillus brevis]QDS36623.1 sigma-70 family RNA polymerase sigma factor [Brevibacillus brevis]
MEKRDIERLLKEIKSGSLDQYEIIIDHYQQPIFTYCYHMLGHRQDAEDAVQEVLFRAYEHLEQYTYSLSFSAWLYRIAYNHCANVLKRRKLRRLLPFLYISNQDGRNYVEEKIDSDYFGEPLESIWSRLSAEERTLMFLRVMEEKEYEEIAVLMDKKPAALRKQFERLLKKCKRYLPTMEGVAADGQ